MADEIKLTAKVKERARGALLQRHADATTVVVPRRPLKMTSTRIVWATSSIVTIAVPVPGEAFGGASAGPLNVAVNKMGAAQTDGAPRSTIARAARIRFMAGLSGEGLIAQKKSICSGDNPPPSPPLEQ